MTARDPRDECLKQLWADHERGASQLARKALGYLAEAARDEEITDKATLRSELDAFARELEGVRPSMVAIGHWVAVWRAQAAALPDDELPVLRAAFADLAQSLVARSQQAAAAAAARAAELIPSGATVLTHSLSSTVREVMGLVQNRATVIFSESRPRLEGHRFGQWLSAAELTGQLITDAQLGHFAAQADVALVGADSVLGDGSVVNKVGTYLLALAARDCGLPFYVCCESFKHTRRLADDFGLEEMDPAELGAPDMPGILVRNIYFDITPARLVTAWIDENEVHENPPEPG
jgi:translation initiation factor 2B subunit (eIF-2B alpha/beta/delta family)